jgi:hypothetical protein
LKGIYLPGWAGFDLLMGGLGAPLSAQAFLCVVRFSGTRLCVVLPLGLRFEMWGGFSGTESVCVCRCFSGTGVVCCMGVLCEIVVVVGWGHL